MYCEEQKSVQSEVSRFVITTHAEFMKTPSTVQAIGHKSQSQEDLKEPESQMKNKIDSTSWIKMSQQRADNDQQQ